MKKRRWIAWLCACVLLAGCTTPAGQGRASAMPTSAPTSAPTPTPTPTSTPTPAPTPAPTPWLQNELYGYGIAMRNPLLGATYCPYDEAYLQKLRDGYGLDALVEGAQGEQEAAQAITAWVSGLWEHDGGNVPRKGDPISILEEAVGQGRRFRCVEYAKVVTACLWAVGIPARTLGLKVADMQTRPVGAGHVVSEYYIRERSKWALADGQWGAMPELDGVPLNAIEFGQAIRDKARYGKRLELTGYGRELIPENYIAFVKEYIYHLDVAYYDAEGAVVKRMLLPNEAEVPTRFQVEYELSVDEFTRSAVGFYAEPGAVWGAG